MKMVMSPDTIGENMDYKLNGYITMIVEATAGFVPSETCEEDLNLIICTEDESDYIINVNGEISSHKSKEEVNIPISYDNLPDDTIVSEGKKRIKVTIIGNIKEFTRNGCYWEVIDHLWYMTQNTSVISIEGNVPNIANVCCENTYNLEGFILHGSNNITTSSYIPTNADYTFSMFGSCRNLANIKFDMTKLEYASNIFNSCRIVNVENMVASNAVDCSIMFYNCRDLNTVQGLDIRNATNINRIFSDCTSLSSISKLNISSAVNVLNAFYRCTSLSYLTLDCDDSWEGADLDLSSCKFDHDGIVALFESLTTNLSGFNINLSGEGNAEGVAALTDEDKAIATDKGWTLTLA